MPLGIMPGAGRKRVTVRNADGTPLAPLAPLGASLMGMKTFTPDGLGGMRRLGTGRLPLFGGGEDEGGGRGHGGGGSGGYARATYGEDDGDRIDAHTYGDSFAKVNRGAAPYSPLSQLDEHLVPLPKRKPEEEGPSVGSLIPGVGGLLPFLPRKAEGGALAPMQPFIAGDPQADGEPNPEVILPMPGGTHVIPLKDLPAFGDGTVSKSKSKSKSGGERTPRVDGRTVMTKGALQPMRGLAEFYTKNPGAQNAAQKEFMKNAGEDRLKPALQPLMPLPKKAYGTVDRVGGLPEVPTALLPLARLNDTRNAGANDATRAAYDDEGNLVGWSAGPVASPRSEALMPMASFASPMKREFVEGMPVLQPLGPRAGVGMADQVNDWLAERTAAGNPFLRPLEPLGGEPTREEAAMGRMQRQVLRASRGDDRLAYSMLQDREQAIAARNAAAARAALEQFQQEQQNARTQMTVEGANSRAEAARKQAADNAIVAWQQNLYKQNMEQVNKILGEQREAEAARQSHPIVDPTTGEVDPYHFMTGTNVTLPSSAKVPGMMTFPGGLSVPTVNGERVPGLPMFDQVSKGWPATPQFKFPGLRFGGMNFLPPMEVPAQPGQAPQYAEKTKPGKSAVSDPVKVRANAYKQALAALDSQIADATTDLERTPLQQARAALLKRQYDEAMKDLDGDGIPDQAQVPAGQALPPRGAVTPAAPVAPAAPARKPTTGFLGLVGE